MNTTFRVLRQFYQYNTAQEVVAGELGISPVHLQRKLRKEGVRYNDLLKRYRVRTIARMIDQGVDNERIAYLIGYKDWRSLQRNFRFLMGKSWREYMRSIEDDMRLVRVA